MALWEPGLCKTGGSGVDRPMAALSATDWCDRRSTESHLCRGPSGPTSSGCGAAQGRAPRVCDRLAGNRPNPTPRRRHSRPGPHVEPMRAPKRGRAPRVCDPSGNGPGHSRCLDLAMWGAQRARVRETGPWAGRAPRVDARRKAKAAALAPGAPFSLF